MINSFITSFKLKNTYRVNIIIYSLKQIPLVKKLLPDSLYKSKGLKIFGNIISSLIELGSIFLGKIFYIYLMIVSVLPFYTTNQSETFLHLFLFLTLCGGFLNTFMFNPTKDKYYAMMIMNMDARKYTLANYYYSLIKTMVGFLPFTIIFGLKFNLPLWLTLIMPIFVVMIKLCASGRFLYDFNKIGKARNENIPTKKVWVIVALLLGLAYGLPYLKITLNILIFMIIFIGFSVLGIYSFIKIKNNNQYKKIYKQLLTPNNIYFDQKESTKVLKDNISKQITYDAKYVSDKKGFEYFNDLFFKRHKKILTESAKKQTIVIFIILVAAIIGIVLSPKTSKEINDILLTYLPYFVFVMYLLNRGTIVTQAMFMNCDHSMLTYRIYRTPKVILGLFKERLKTLIKINLLPALAIAFSLCLLLLLTGGTNNIFNYLILFISIIAMSIFFSVHYLVMYYLLQPYNVNTEMKSSTYSIVQSLTYVVCYFMIGLKLPTIIFGLAMTLFCIIYSLISLLIANKLAPRTFKLRN